MRSPLPRWLFAVALIMLVAATTPVASSQEETNLVRNAGFEDGAAHWSLPKTFGVVDDVTHSGAHSLRLVNTPACTPSPSRPRHSVRFGA